MCARRLFLILSLCGACFSWALSYSQDRSGKIISGTVADKSDGKGVQGARITLTDKVSGRIYSYVFTDSSGDFDISTKGVNEPWVLNVSSIGYKSKQLIIETIPNKKILLEIESSEVVLNEVKITAPKVTLKGDTLNFTAPGFIKEGDRSVEEVLKRIPGVEITDGGQIRYNDKPINAFYIDGKNMLDGKYSIATKNLPPDILSMIQIFENHQPVKALKNFSPSENAAINIKLKPEAKAKWVTTGDLAAGIPGPMFDSKILLFRFGKGVQTMNVVKGNNRGKSIGSEIKTQLLGASAQTRLLYNEELNMVNVTGVTDPPIGEERSLFNKSGYFSSNAIFNINEITEATLKFGYSYEKKEREQQEWTDYYLPEGLINRLGEESSYNGLTERPEADFVIKSNSEKYFLQNRINFRGRIENRNTTITGLNELFSRADIGQYDLSGAITWIKPYERSLLKMTSNSQITESPQKLSVENSDQGFFREQEALFKQVISENNISFIIRRGALTAEAGTGVNLRYQRLNNSENILTELSLSGRIRYEKERIKINMFIPFKLRNSKSGAEPEFSLRYRFSPYWEGSAGYTRSVRIAGVVNTYPEEFMVNYRYYYTGYDNLWMSADNTYYVRGIYNNPLKLINVSATFGYSKSKHDVTSSTYILDSYITKTEIPVVSYGNSVSATLNFAKSFFETPLLLDLRVQFLKSESEIIQQGMAVNIMFNRITVTPKAEISVGRYLDMEGIFPLSRYIRKSVSGVGASASFTTANPTVNLTLRLTERVSVMLNNTVYINEISEGDFSYFPFTDLKARVKRAKGEFFTEFTNLFNNKSFKYKIVSDLFISERIYRLRPIGFIAGYSFTF